MSAETNVPLMTHHTFSTILVQQTGKCIFIFYYNYNNVHCDYINEMTVSADHAMCRCGKI